MNSAAKLRSRGIAAFGAAALIATAFGPAAIAWDESGLAGKHAAKSATFGLVDSDDNAAGTQGAQAVSPGATEQAIAAMRFVIPATWKAGDKLVFSIGQKAGAAADITKRISFAGTPKVTIAPTAYASTTHIAPTSGQQVHPGDVEAGKEVAYAVPSGGVAPVAPEFTVSMSSSLNNPAYQDQVIVTFSNTNDTGAAAAKFIGSLNDVKINVGAAVEPGDVVVEAKALDSGQANDATGKNVFYNGENQGTSSSTVPATVVNGSLTVSNPSVVADGSTQFIGPITVTKTDGRLIGAVEVGLTGATFDTTANSVKVKQYNAAGAPVGSEISVTPQAGSLSVDGLDAATTKIEFTGAAVIVTRGSLSVEYKLGGAGGANHGGIAIPGPVLGAGVGNTLNQTDIAAPASVAEVKVRPGGQAADFRVSGFDRYSTAAQLAVANPEGFVNPGVLDSARFQNSVVLVSGTSFADALSAGYLAKVTSSRILLTEPDALPGATSDFIRNYGVKDVYIVGGTSAVSSALEASLRNRLVTNVSGTESAPVVTEEKTQKLNVVRISGPDRFVTNRNVNRYAYEKASGVIGSMVPAYGSAKKPTAVFVSGTTPWDALAASPMVSNNLPVVLTTPGLHDQAKGQIGDFGIGYGIVVGGEGVISGAAEAELKGRGLATFRVAGENRFATANAVNDLLLKPAEVTAATTGPEGFGFQNRLNPFLVNGGVVAGAPDATKWADALALGPIAATKKSMVLLTDSASLPAALETWLKGRVGLSAVLAVGGADVVSDAVIAAANAALNK